MTRPTDGTAGSDISYGVYTLYNDDGYVVAAVVVGDSASISSNVAYVISDSISSESYDRSTGMWTWTRDVIINGEEVELTETNDTGVSELKNSAIMKQYNWVTVKYDANGNVKAVEDFDDADKFFDNASTAIEDAVEAIEKDEEFVVVSVADEDTTHKYTLKGHTLYDDTTGVLGFRVADDVKIALEQETNRKTTVEYYEGVDTLDAILDDLNEDAKQYEFNAVIENGRATSVIIIDKGADNDITGPDGKPVKKGSLELTGVTYDDTKDTYDIAMRVTKEIKGAATWSAEITTANGAKVASAYDVAFITNDWAVGSTPIANVSGAKKAAEELKIVVTFYDEDGDVLATGEDFLAI